LIKVGIKMEKWNKIRAVKMDGDKNLRMLKSILLGIGKAGGYIFGSYVRNIGVLTKDGYPNCSHRLIGKISVFVEDQTAIEKYLNNSSILLSRSKNSDSYTIKSPNSDLIDYLPQSIDFYNQRPGKAFNISCLGMKFTEKGVEWMSWCEQGYMELIDGIRKKMVMIYPEHLQLVLHNEFKMKELKENFIDKEWIILEPCVRVLTQFPVAAEFKTDHFGMREVVESPRTARGCPNNETNGWF
jgi:hypothetical protein